jgi:hypothetical protein
MKIASAPIEKCIQTVRGEKVILASDLAGIYGVPTRVLNQTVKRNRGRFPSDFCFQLNATEWKHLRSQIVTSSYGSRFRPWVFTEHGAIMAANILRSEKAIQMSVFVVRAFVRMRNLFSDTKALAGKLDKLEREVTSRLDSHEKAIVELMRQFLTIINPENDSAEDEKSTKREIGFHVKDTAERKSVRSKRAR